MTLTLDDIGNGYTEDMEPLPDFPDPPTQTDLLTQVVGLLLDIKDALSAQGTGGNGTSSVQLEYRAKGPPALTLKRYNGSEPEIDNAVADYQYAVTLVAAMDAEQWRKTVEYIKQQATQPEEPV